MNEISANNDNYQLSGEQDTQDISKKLHERYTKNDIVLAIGRNKGIKTAIARELDCTIYQLNHYLNIHSELKPLLKDAKKEIIGLAEEVMLQNLQSDDDKISQKAAEFILKTLGKDEYSEKPQTEINIKSDSEIDVQIRNIFGLDT